MSIDDDDGLIDATRKFLENTAGTLANRYYTPSGQWIATIVIADYHAPLGLLPDLPHYVLAKRVLFHSEFKDEKGGPGISVPYQMLDRAAKGNGIIVHYHNKEFYEMPSREWLLRGKYRADAKPDPDVGLPFSTLRRMFGERRD